jgi:hypothetical protein
MAYLIKTSKGQAYSSMIAAIQGTGLREGLIRKLCMDPDSGWSVSGGRYGQPPWMTRALKKYEAPKPVEQVVKIDLTDLTQQVQALTALVQSLREEVRSLNDNALNLMTLPAGTQLNLPGLPYML